MKYKGLTIRLMLAIMLALSLALIIDPPIVSQAAPAITLYANDRPGWEGAVVSFDEEFFTDASLNPGISVISDYPGYVDTTKGVWWDRLNCPGYGVTTTTWQFDPPIVAFGGNWNPGIPGGSGAGIAVDDSPSPVDQPR